MRTIEKVARKGVIAAIKRAIPRDVKGQAKRTFAKVKKQVAESDIVQNVLGEGKRRHGWDTAFRAQAKDTVGKVKAEGKKRVKGAIRALGGAK